MVLVFVGRLSFMRDLQKELTEAVLLIEGSQPFCETAIEIAAPHLDGAQRAQDDSCIRGAYRSLSHGLGLRRPVEFYERSSKGVDRGCPSHRRQPTLLRDRHRDCSAAPGRTPTCTGR